MRLSRVQRVLILAGSLVLQAACGGSTFAGSVGGTAAATSGGRTAAGSTGSGTGTASGGASGSGTGPAFMGPSCRTDADCNGGQTGTEIVCGAQGDCVVGCHSSTDCSPGDVCDSSVGDGHLRQLRGREDLGRRHRPKFHGSGLGPDLRSRVRRDWKGSNHEQRRHHRLPGSFPLGADL